MEPRPIVHAVSALILAAALVGCNDDTKGEADQGMPDLTPPADLGGAARDGTAGDLSLGPYDLAVVRDLLSMPDLVTVADGGGGGQGPNASIGCGNVNCTPPKGVCCRGLPFGAGTCQPPNDPCGQFRFFCANNADCANPGDVCCVRPDGSDCRPLAACNLAMGRIGCQAMLDCPPDQKECCGVGPSPNYYCSAGPCPISRRKYKVDIRYLDEGERAALHRALLGYRLSRWRYRDDATRGQHLGFLIDDVGDDSPAVEAGGKRVDLYGYTSMAVAAIQEQAREIEALRRELAALRRDLGRARSSGSRR